MRTRFKPVMTCKGIQVVSRSRTMICWQAISPGATRRTRPGLVAICVPAVVANCTCCSCSLTFRTSAAKRCQQRGASFVILKEEGKDRSEPLRRTHGKCDDVRHRDGHSRGVDIPQEGLGLREGHTLSAHGHVTVILQAVLTGTLTPAKETPKPKKIPRKCSKCALNRVG